MDFKDCLKSNIDKFSFANESVCSIISTCSLSLNNDDPPQVSGRIGIAPWLCCGYDATNTQSHPNDQLKLINFGSILKFIFDNIPETGSLNDIYWGGIVTKEESSTDLISGKSSEHYYLHNSDFCILDTTFLRWNGQIDEALTTVESSLTSSTMFASNRRKEDYKIYMGGLSTNFDSLIIQFFRANKVSLNQSSLFTVILLKTLTLPNLDSMITNCNNLSVHPLINNNKILSALIKVNIKPSVRLMIHPPQTSIRERNNTPKPLNLNLNLLDLTKNVFPPSLLSYFKEKEKLPPSLFPAGCIPITSLSNISYQYKLPDWAIQNSLAITSFTSKYTLEMITFPLSTQSNIKQLYFKLKPGENIFTNQGWNKGGGESSTITLLLPGNVGDICSLCTLNDGTVNIQASCNTIPIWKNGCRVSYIYSENVVDQDIIVIGSLRYVFRIHKHFSPLVVDNSSNSNSNNGVSERITTANSKGDDDDDNDNEGSRKANTRGIENFEYICKQILDQGEVEAPLTRSRSIYSSNKNHNNQSNRSIGNGNNNSHGDSEYSHWNLAEEKLAALLAVEITHWGHWLGCSILSCWIIGHRTNRKTEGAGTTKLLKFTLAVDQQSKYTSEFESLVPGRTRRDSITSVLSAASHTSANRSSPTPPFGPSTATSQPVTSNPSNSKKIFDIDCRDIKTVLSLLHSLLALSLRVTEALTAAWEIAMKSASKEGVHRKSKSKSSRMGTSRKSSGHGQQDQYQASFHMSGVSCASSMSLFTAFDSLSEALCTMRRDTRVGRIQWIRRVARLLLTYELVNVKFLDELNTLGNPEAESEVESGKVSEEQLMRVCSLLDSFWTKYDLENSAKHSEIVRATLRGTMAWSLQIGLLVFAPPSISTPVTKQSNRAVASLPNIIFIDDLLDFLEWCLPVNHRLYFPESSGYEGVAEEDFEKLSKPQQRTLLLRAVVNHEFRYIGASSDSNSLVSSSSAGSTRSGKARYKSIRFSAESLILKETLVECEEEYDHDKAKYESSREGGSLPMVGSQREQEKEEMSEFRTKINTLINGNISQTNSKAEHEHTPLPVTSSSSSGSKLSIMPIVENDASLYIPPFQPMLTQYTPYTINDMSTPPITSPIDASMSEISELTMMTPSPIKANTLPMSSDYAINSDVASPSLSSSSSSSSSNSRTVYYSAFSAIIHKINGQMDELEKKPEPMSMRALTEDIDAESINLLSLETPLGQKNNSNSLMKLMALIRKNHVVVLTRVLMRWSEFKGKTATKPKIITTSTTSNISHRHEDGNNQNLRPEHASVSSLFKKSKPMGMSIPAFKKSTLLNNNGDIDNINDNNNDAASKMRSDQGVIEQPEQQKYEVSGEFTPPITTLAVSSASTPNFTPMHSFRNVLSGSSGSEDQPYRKSFLEEDKIIRSGSMSSEDATSRFGSGGITSSPTSDKFHFRMSNTGHEDQWKDRRKKSQPIKVMISCEQEVNYKRRVYDEDDEDDEEEDNDEEDNEDDDHDLLGSEMSCPENCSGDDVERLSRFEAKYRIRKIPSAIKISGSSNNNISNGNYSNNISRRVSFEDNCNIPVEEQLEVDQQPQPHRELTENMEDLMDNHHEEDVETFYPFIQNEEVLWQIFSHYAGIQSGKLKVSVPSRSTSQQRRHKKKLLSRDSLWNILRDFNICPGICSKVKLFSMVAEVSDNCSSSSSSIPFSPSFSGNITTLRRSDDSPTSSSPSPQVSLMSFLEFEKILLKLSLSCDPQSYMPSSYHSNNNTQTQTTTSSTTQSKLYCLFRIMEESNGRDKLVRQYISHFVLERYHSPQSSFRCNTSNTISTTGNTGSMVPPSVSPLYTPPLPPPPTTSSSSSSFSTQQRVAFNTPQAQWQTSSQSMDQTSPPLLPSSSSSSSISIKRKNSDNSLTIGTTATTTAFNTKYNSNSNKVKTLPNTNGLENTTANDVAPVHSSLPISSSTVKYNKKRIKNNKTRTF